MAYTLLQLVDQVSGELGLGQPTVVMGSTNNQTMQLRALAQRLGKDLARDFEWNRLVKAYIFQTTAATTCTANLVSGSAIVTNTSVDASFLYLQTVITGTGVAPYAEILTIESVSQFTMTMPATTSGTGVTLTFATQDYALPSDFDRMVEDTNWDRTNHWRNLGPKSSQEWQTLQGGLISTGPRERFRIYNNKLRIFPAVTTVYNIAYEYVSTNWVYNPGEQSAAQTIVTRAQFAEDSDKFIYPDNLMAAGLKYYFLKAKKLDFAVEMAEFDNILSQCKAQDQPQGVKSLAPIFTPELIGPWSVPEGNWPQS